MNKKTLLGWGLKKRGDSLEEEEEELWLLVVWPYTIAADQFRGIDPTAGFTKGRRVSCSTKGVPCDVCCATCCCCSRSFVSMRNGNGEEKCRVL